MSAITFSGPEFQVNTTTASSQSYSDVAASPNGGYIVTWTSLWQDNSSNGIYAQRYDVDGNKLGGEFQVNTTTDEGQVLSKVAALESGGFVITWMSRGQDVALEPTSYGVYAQRYNADGVALGGEFQVNTYAPGEQREPAIAALGDGGFVITWMSAGQEGGTDPQYGIYAQRYDAGGAAVGAEFLVNTTTQDRQIEPDIYGLENGGFVVIWSGGSQDSYAQIYGADGVAVGVEFRLNTTVPGFQFQPKITALKDGGFVTTWTASGQDGDQWGIFGQRYDADGTALGAEFQANTFIAGSQQDPSVSALADGGFVIVWTSPEQDGDGNGIYAQRFDANGAPVGAETLINTTTTHYQYQSSVVELEDGGFVITWTSFEQDGSNAGVFAQQFKAQLFGTFDADTMSDTVGADWMRGQGGDDTLYGLDGNDLIMGGGGDDTLYGGEGSDRLKGNKGNDVLYGEAGNDFLRGMDGEDTLVGGAGMDALRGGAGADRFVFNAISDSTLSENDRIMDFEIGVDMVDLSAVIPGSFSFIGGDGFSGTGAEVRMMVNDAGNTILRIDVDGDGAADMKIFMAGNLALSETDFIL